MIEVRKQGSSFLQTEATKFPATCDRCHRPFWVRPRVKFVGVPIEEMS